MRSLFFFTLFSLAFLVLLCQPAESEYGITMKTNNSSYEPGDGVIIVVTVLEESNITVQVNDPSGNPILLESSSSKNGTAIITFVLEDNASEGKYRIFASSVTFEGEDYAIISCSFEIEEDGKSFLDGIPLPDPTLNVR